MCISYPIVYHHHPHPSITHFFSKLEEHAEAIREHQDAIESLAKLSRKDHPELPTTFASPGRLKRKRTGTICLDPFHTHRQLIGMLIHHGAQTKQCCRLSISDRWLPCDKGMLIPDGRCEDNLIRRRATHLMHELWGGINRFFDINGNDAHIKQKGCDSISRRKLIPTYTYAR